MRLRLAFALQDNHEAGGALAELMRLLPKHESTAAPPAKSADDAENAEEESRTESPIERIPYTAGHVYPPGAADWTLQESAVYPNITGANLQQIQETIDTLLNFAPLVELATALESADLGDAGKRDLRAVIAERYLAQENFAEAKKFMPAEQFKVEAEKLESLTAATTGSASEKAVEMRLGDAWSEARGKLLRAPLETKIGLIPNSSLARRPVSPRQWPVAPDPRGG